VPSLGPALRPDRDAAALAQIAAIARRFRPDLIHTHTAKAGFIGRLAALGALRPRPVLVHTFHGHVLEGYFGPLRNRLYRSLEAGLARRTDRLVGVSEATADDLVRLGIAPRDRFRVIPLGLDLEPFANADAAAGSRLRREVGIGEEELVLTFVGRLVAIKQVDLLLRAFAHVGAEVQPRLLVVGDGELRARHEALARDLGIADRVSFLGYRRDLPALAAATDLAVLASANEGTPVSLIEAAAAGVPAVATRVGGVPEVVTPEAGMLVPPGDPEALAGAISRLGGDPEQRTRLGAGAREHVLSRFAVERLIADVESLYEELLDDRDRSARLG
jgi:glycosyltransferase involved in cell wall biosynthesis